MKRLALGILLAFVCAACFGANPLPPAVQQAIDKLTADTQAYSLASGSFASAQAALAAAQNQLTAVQAQTAAPSKPRGDGRGQVADNLPGDGHDPDRRQTTLQGNISSQTTFLKT